MKQTTAVAWELDDEGQDLIRSYVRAKADLEDAQAKVDRLRQDVIGILADHQAQEGTLQDQVVVRWQTVTSWRLDTDRLKREMPDVYEHFRGKRVDSARLTVELPA